MEINDFSVLQDVATDLLHHAPSSWQTLGDTVARLRNDPSYVLGLTIQLPSDPIRQPFHNLPFPDFDETGFYGRKSELKRIKQALKSAWPVVSILGDGGIGKTSIALKAAYDILDDPSFEFEAIVWASAKATTLTTTEIVNISGAIQDSLGLFKVAAGELGIPQATSEEAADEVLQYLAAFKILLVLDNLETVSDQRLRDFLLGLPPGSKVLVTSRIGLGLENPVKLGPLSNEETRRFLRALASIRNVEVLKTLDAKGIDKFVDRLNGHPLFIKWLVSGVEAGKRPSDLFSDNTLLLDFCMSNVFDQLSTKARTVLQSLQVVQGQRGQAELAFISDLSAFEIQETLLELMKTNFISMKRSNFDEFEGIYQTEEFARQYLAKNQPIESSFRLEITERSKELSRIGRDLKSMTFSSRYDPRSIDTRGPHDIPAAKMLVDAQRLVSQGSLDEALGQCREAQLLSPSYYEAWRLEASIHVQRRDTAAATDAFTTALSLTEDSPIINYHFGKYLLEEVGDYPAALDYLQRTARLDGTSEEVLEALASAYFLAGDYAKSLDTCVGQIQRGAASGGSRFIMLHLMRSAVFGVETSLWDGRLGDALELTDVATEALVSADLTLIPATGCDWISRLADGCRRVEAEGESEDYLVRRAKTLSKQLDALILEIDPRGVDRKVGIIVKTDPEKHFAFINYNDRDYFFHHNALLVRSEWADVDINRLAAFKVDPGAAKGPRATEVRILS
ncbi:tetratricopeptide repeat protein [Paeniglutamicibacter sp. R2-26]|uniref:tetratricopeptide repeat protein n=1 Tax=Paeniglutamicibacter sp. R2-26 TaxID=3144417 RepID=UPI003EE545EC